jgi:malate dehydrogenase (oxaloacetate-decarboxylating)(NADP+)
LRCASRKLIADAGVDFEIVNNESDPRFKEYWSEYYQLMKRRGITQEQAQRAVISNTTVIGASWCSAAKRMR